MTNCPLAKRKPAGRVVLRVNSLSVQWWTSVTRSSVKPTAMLLSVFLVILSAKSLDREHLVSIFHRPGSSAGAVTSDGTPPWVKLWDSLVESGIQQGGRCAPRLEPADSA